MPKHGITSELHPKAYRGFFPSDGRRGERKTCFRLRYDSPPTRRIDRGGGRYRGPNSPSCENIKAAVEGAGGTLQDVGRVDVYVRNMEHFDAIHKVRREYFNSPLPASTMVEVTKMVSPDYLIEINAIAVIPD